MIPKVALALCILAPLVAAPARVLAAPLPADTVLSATFLADPIPADVTASSTLRVEIVHLLPAAGSDDGRIVTIEVDPATGAVCTLAGADAARVPIVAGHAEIAVRSTGVPGRCHVTALAEGAASGEAVLTTMFAGTGTRLTVSGNDSPRQAGEAITISVDVDDVYVNLVGGDQTTAVDPALDPRSCTGAPGGPVTIAAANGGIAVDGRTWFTARSDGAYGACRITFSAPGLRPGVTTVTVSPGPEDHLSCRFSAATIAPFDVTAVAVELRDAAGNRVATGRPFTIAVTRQTGDSTELLADIHRMATMGTAFFYVRAGAVAGIDAYVAAIAPESSTSLRLPETTCAVEVRSPVL